MQTPKSSAHIYKEARLNKIPYESLVASQVSSTPAPSSKKNFLSNIWIPAFALILIGVRIEAAVVYAKGSDTNILMENSEPNVSNSVIKNASSHREIYTKNTAKLIQEALTNSKKRASLSF